MTRPETALTDAERESLLTAMCIARLHAGGDHDSRGACVVADTPPYAVVERILTAHIEAERERIASHDAALIEQARAEGKAEADAAWAARVEAVAADRWENFDGSEVTVDGPAFRALLPADSTALDEVRARAKAEALREVADWLNGPKFPDGTGDWLDGVCDAIDILRTRAAALSDAGRGAQ